MKSRVWCGVDWCGLVLGGLVLGELWFGSVAMASPPESDAHRQAVSMAVDLSLAFEHASETIEASVVHITTENENRRGFRRRTGLGSGVIADKRGYILTNAHVIEGGNYLNVRLNDGREMAATLIGTFAETDIAVIKIEADGLVAAEFGDSEGLRVGQWVLAVGSPFGFQQSVTAGIVSAKGRGSINASMSDNNTVPQKFQEFIQTDAAINPGNSGGPLVDLQGRVIGINTAILSRSGGNNGLGFAIPIDIASAVMNRIIENGRVDRGWFGVQMGELDPIDAIKLDIEGGVVLRRVVEDGPAHLAGLRDGDVVVSLGGRATENIVRMGNAIMLARPGVPVDVSYYRGKRLRHSKATLQDRDEQLAIARGQVYIESLGLVIVPSEQEFVRGRRVVGRVSGFRVVEVRAHSTADEAGFEVGDFLYDIGGHSFEDARDVEDYFVSADFDTGVRIKVIRDRERGYIDLKND